MRTSCLCSKQPGGSSPQWLSTEKFAKAAANTFQRLSARKRQPNSQLQLAVLLRSNCTLWQKQPGLELYSPLESWAEALWMVAMFLFGSCSRLTKSGSMLAYEATTAVGRAGRVPVSTSRSQATNAFAFPAGVIS